MLELSLLFQFRRSFLTDIFYLARHASLLSTCNPGLASSLMISMIAEKDILNLIPENQVEVIHLGADKSKVKDAESAGVKSVPALVCLMVMCAQCQS